MRRLRDPGSDRALCSAPPPPVVGCGDDNDVDWVARGLFSSNDGSIMALKLRWLLASLLPSGGDGGGGRDARGIPGRGEEDEYRGRKVQGRLDEAQRGWEERRAVAVASGPEMGSQGRGGSSGVAGDGDGRGLDSCAADAPPSCFGEGGLSSCPLLMLRTRRRRWLQRWRLEVEE